MGKPRSAPRGGAKISAESTTTGHQAWSTSSQTEHMPAHQPAALTAKTGLLRSVRCRDQVTLKAAESVCTAGHA